MADHADDLRTVVASLLDEISAIGAPSTADGGWNRLAWTEADRSARTWFGERAEALGLEVGDDRAGNRWAWWPPPATEAVLPDAAAVVTGSHLDTVPDGGAFDGALGVVAGLAAVTVLRTSGREPVRPVAVVAFADEEGARFATPTFGSRLLTGALDAKDVRGRLDHDGVELTDALRAAGLDPDRLGPDPGRVARIGAMVEVHVEQGRGLADLGAPLGIASAVWPRGRWALRIDGEANHAGTTPLAQRRDASVVLAAAVRAARDAAARHGGVATLGRQRLWPNAASAVPGAGEALLDARAPDEATLDAIVTDWRTTVEAAAATERCDHRIDEMARSAGVTFDAGLRERLRAAAVRATASLLEPPPDAATASLLEPPPDLSTAAGHDAAVLTQAGVPAGMVFVRNPTGVSHAPGEHADLADVVAGVRTLATLLEELAWP